MKTPLEYLEPDFDPKKETIASLSSMLSNHGIRLPNTKQKKQFYVDLYVNELAPKAQKIMEDLENVKPSNEGITIVKSKIPIKSVLKPVLKSANFGQDVTPKSSVKSTAESNTKLVLDTKDTETEPKIDLKQLQERFESLAKTQVVQKQLEKPIETKRKLAVEKTPERTSAIPKRVKTTPEFKFIENHLKFKRPLTPLQVKKQRFLDQIERDETVPAPTRNRFMILPVLPGVRSKIPSEGTVRDLASKYDSVVATHKQESMDTLVESDQESTCTVQPTPQSLQDWEDAVPRAPKAKKQSSLGLWVFIMVIFLMVWVFAQDQVIETANVLIKEIHRRFPNEYAVVETFMNRMQELVYVKGQEYWLKANPVIEKPLERVFDLISFIQIQFAKNFNVSRPFVEKSGSELDLFLQSVQKEVIESLGKMYHLGVACSLHYVSEPMQIYIYEPMTEMIKNTLERIKKGDVQEIKDRVNFFLTRLEKNLKKTVALSFDWINKVKDEKFVNVKKTAQQFKKRAETGELKGFVIEKISELKTNVIENKNLVLGTACIVAITVAITFQILFIFQ